MLRITLGGPEFVDFPPNQAGGYLKLLLDGAGDAERSIVRTYTIRHQRNGEFDVDFALHADAHDEAGPATRWALAAQPGDTIAIGGPGAAKPLPAGFDYFLNAGDMTALPAIAVNLESLAHDARGAAFLEVRDEADRQDLIAPPGIDIHWLINPVPGSRPELLEDAVRSVPWPAGRLYAWAACEFSGMRRLRAYLREERGLGSDRLYLSSYWKSGLAEEAHKIVKRDDANSAVTGRAE
ncbi:siderophore-interacting protein [Aurantiacibacter arachoides]|nr:siderophore-interacting protein [Aurantiacibacter arachoides]